MISIPKQATINTFISRMETEGLPQLFIENFKHYYQLLLSGESGLISESSLKVVEQIPDADTFSQHYVEVGETVLCKTAVIKLNGGLGTSMGLQQAKSLLPVKNELTFLDIIAKQAESQDLPLVLMNSFSTDEDTIEKLKPYSRLSSKNLPLRFLQHKQPKIRQDDFQPAICSENPNLEWCPPGHGDIYTALVTSGTLDALLSAGYEYAFVSNVDNLGAVIDISILGYFAEQQVPFMMEVADRTSMDKKGGHLAMQHDGQLILRESAQCPDEDINAFQDIRRHKYFNTNNLWLHLPTLKKVMSNRAFKLGLPMIRNAKTIDPRNKNSTPVYQIETAMGSAIGVFKGAKAIRVPRTRFAPVKTTNDLLVVQSDAYELTKDHHMVQTKYGKRFEVSLDNEYYKLVSDFNGRFPHGVPSIAACQSFKVTGDIQFGKNITCQGNVELINSSTKQVLIPDETTLEGKIEF